MSTPLNSIRVIDCGQYRAAPLVALLLADNSANEIQITDPRPDRNPHGSRAHTYVNNGKRTVLLVTAAEEGEEGEIPA
jgi:crotonobetainyl-CoA:carnitine CoA-transferase CaiB-like acyl-CoA transferase